jgi:hypothetical protein
MFWQCKNIILSSSHVASVSHEKKWMPACYNLKCMVISPPIQNECWFACPVREGFFAPSYIWACKMYMDTHIMYMSMQNVYGYPYHVYEHAKCIWIPIWMVDQAQLRAILKRSVARAQKVASCMSPLQEGTDWKSETTILPKKNPNVSVSAPIKKTRQTLTRTRTYFTGGAEARGGQPYPAYRERSMTWLCSTWWNGQFLTPLQ